MGTRRYTSFFAGNSGQAGLGACVGQCIQACVIGNSTASDATPLRLASCRYSGQAGQAKVKLLNQTISPAKQTALFAWRHRRANREMKWFLSTQSNIDVFMAISCVFLGRWSALYQPSDRLQQQRRPGPPGEVSNQQLNDTIVDTPHNPGSIGPFTGGFSDPPTQAEMQAFAAYVESLRAALVR